MFAMLGTNSALQVQLDAIQTRLDGTFGPTPTEEINALQTKWRVKWIIHAIFLAFISLLCILTFFAGLSRSI